MHMWSNALIKLCCIILCSLLHKSEVSAATCGTFELNSHHIPAFDGWKVSDFHLTTWFGREFVWDCTRLCWSQVKCRSYTFNSDTGVCSTFAVGYSDQVNTYNETVMEPGNKLYLMCGRLQSFGSACVSDEDCNYNNAQCRDGKCGCDVGYSFESSSGNCVVRCEVYGDFYDEYPNRGVGGCNLDSGYFASVDDVMESCRGQTDFVCVQAECRTDLYCHLCNIAWMDLAEAAREIDNSNWFLIHRHCHV